MTADPNLSCSFDPDRGNFRFIQENHHQLWITLLYKLPTDCAMIEKTKKYKSILLFLKDYF